MFWCDVFGIRTDVCGCKYHNETCYKDIIIGMGVMSLWFSCCCVVILMLICFKQVDHCKYNNELFYKAPWVVSFAFNSPCWL